MTNRFTVLLIFTVWLLLGAASVSRAVDTGGPMLVAREFHHAVTIDPYIYVLGGLGSPEEGPQIDVFDPASRRWAVATRYEDRPKGMLFGVAISGRLFVLDEERRRCSVFDPYSKSWQKVAPPISQRANPTVIAFEEKIYVIGGYAPGLSPQHSVEIYDPAKDKWAPGPALPGFKENDHFFLAAVLDDRLHVMGGMRSDDVAVEHWALEKGIWSRKADMPVGGLWKASALEAAGGGLFLFNPLLAKDHVGGDVFRYEPRKDSWQAIGHTPPNFPDLLFASAAHKGRIYLFGGRSVRESAPRKDLYIFDPATTDWRAYIPARQ